MTPRLDRIRAAITTARGGDRPVCLLCQRAVEPGEHGFRLRGGAVLHRCWAADGMGERRMGGTRRS